MAWRYDIYSKYCEDEHEYETGFLTESEAEEACEDRVNEIIEDNELDPEDEQDIDWSVDREDDDDFSDILPNADEDDIEEEIMSHI